MKTTAAKNNALKNKIDNEPTGNDGFIDKDGVYHLSDDQLEKLRIANEQIENGEYIDQDDLDKLLEQWLKEK